MSDALFCGPRTRAECVEALILLSSSRVCGSLRGEHRGGRDRLGQDHPGAAVPCDPRADPRYARTAYLGTGVDLGIGIHGMGLQ